MRGVDLVGLETRLEPLIAPREIGDIVDATVLSTTQQFRVRSLSFILILQKFCGMDHRTSRKAFVPLENNPDVMTNLVHELGLSKSLQFHDVFSLYEPSLLEFLPRPAIALMLVFPVTKTYEKFRAEEDASKPEYTGSGPQEPVIWYKQTIRNACGLMGLLHAVSNGEAREKIEAGSKLEKLIQDAIPLSPVQRSDLLYESESLESAHAGAATKGDTSAPDAEDDIDLHFVTFIKDPKTGDVWELDGSRKGPLNRGRLAMDKDLLSEEGQELSVRAFLKREEEVGGGELRFSVIMLGPNMD